MTVFDDRHVLPFFAEIGDHRHGGSMMAFRNLLLLALRLSLARYGVSLESASCSLDQAFVSLDGSEISSSNDFLDFGEDMGSMQNLEIDEDHFEEIQDILYDARQYLHRFNFSNPKFRALRDQCKNHHELCGLWAVLGECHNNPLFMNTTCAPVCQSCEFLLPEFRCPIDPNEVDAWYPGDVNAMFERIIIQPAYVKYEPHILSSPQRPSYDALDSSSKRGPWILQLDQFLSDEEADRLIELGIDTGFQPSYTALGSRPDGSLDAYADTSRTSSSTYCDSATCLQDPTIQSVIERLEQLTHVPESHYEHFHMLRYDVGQFFDTHSDFLYQHRNRQEGVRIFSVLMYLNDVNEGGTTRFKHMNLTIAPKRGRAVVWPSVLDGDPNSQDNRTDHESMPVLQGTKYAINVLVHQRDYKTPHAKHCTLK